MHFSYDTFPRRSLALDQTLCATWSELPRRQLWRRV
jgi:hypothetical protein